MKPSSKMLSAGLVALALATATLTTFAPTPAEACGYCDPHGPGQQPRRP